MSLPHRMLISIPGLHRVPRGAEAALENIGRELARQPDFSVTLAGSGPPREGEPYQYLEVPCRPRERFEKWPRIPVFRNEYRWEEFSFVRNLRRAIHPGDFDITLTCSFPFVHWFLRRGRMRPPHVFVTENGDHPAHSNRSEYRFFACDGLVCTNPEYLERNRNRFPSILIPNGIDTARFVPGPGQRSRFTASPNSPLVLMVSALIPSKYVADGIEAVARIPEASLVVAGDGPLRDECDTLAKERLGDRYRRLTLPPTEMPALYQSAECLLHLSRDEAFGNIYIEAAACGLPVVAHDCPLTRWILGPDGCFADGRDGEAVTAAIRQALEADRDSETRSQRHHTIAERFSWRVIGEAYANFLRTILTPKQ